MASNQPKRLGVLSFYIENLHYNLGVRLLNDKFGIQVRGGCSCAGTYGHYLLHVDHDTSDAITEAISFGDLSAKPGWIRLSIHPTMSEAEIQYLLKSIEALAQNFHEWEKDYEYSPKTNEYAFKEGGFVEAQQKRIEKMFTGTLN